MPSRRAGRCREQAAQRHGVEPRPRLREQRGRAGGRRSARARAVDAGEARRSLVVLAGVGGRDPDAGRDELGLDPAVERESARRERGDAAGPGWAASSPARSRLRVGSGLLRGERRERAARRARDDGDVERRVDAERSCGERRAEEDDRCRPPAPPARVVGGAVARADSAAFPATRRVAAGVEEVGQPGALRRCAAASRREVESRRRRDRAEQRHGAVEQQVESAADDDAHLVEAAARVGRADGERSRRAARPGDAPVARPRGAVVARGRDDERVERRGAVDGPGLGAVGEGGKGLGEAEQRDPRGVVGVAVVVRVDGALEPCDDLVAAAVDR